MTRSEKDRPWSRVVGFATMAAAALLASCSAETADGSAAPSIEPPAATGAIVFSRAGGDYGDETIFTARVDGSDERALIDLGSGCCASVSPDGSTVLFLENRAGPLMSSTVPIEGGEVTPLASPDQTMNFVGGAWSPDGSRIAHEAWDDSDPSRTGVYTSSYPDGGDLVRVTEGVDGAHDSPTDYSPDGSQIVFYRNAVGSEWDVGGSLWIGQADGSGARELPTPGVAPSWWAKWSPDGEWITFATGRNQGDGAIWLIRPDGSDLHAVYEAEEGTYPITPSFSPDGSMILFALDPVEDEWAHPDNSAYVIPTAGGAPSRLFGGDAFQRRFDWFRQ